MPRERLAMLADLLLFAEDAAPAPGGQPGWYSMLPFLILPIFLLLIMTRSARKQERERMSLVNTMTKGDEVLTAAGIYGTVISVHETKDEVVVKVDDGTRLRMTKASIQRNMTKEEAKAPAQKS